MVWNNEQVTWQNRACDPLCLCRASLGKPIETLYHSITKLWSGSNCFSFLSFFWTLWVSAVHEKHTPAFALFVWCASVIVQLIEWAPLLISSALCVAVPFPYIHSHTDNRWKYSDSFILADSGSSAASHAAFHRHTHTRTHTKNGEWWYLLWWVLQRQRGREMRFLDKSEFISSFLKYAAGSERMVYWGHGLIQALIV